MKRKHIAVYFCITLLVLYAGIARGEEPHIFKLQWGLYGSGNGQLIWPEGVAVGSSGNIYVADNNNNRIQKFSSSGNYLTQWGSFGSGNGQFNSPSGMAIDSSGNIYIADRGNHRIQKFSSDGSYLTQWGSYGNGNGQFNSPYGVAVDSSSNVYVADTSNHRIQKFNSNGSYLTQWGSSGSGNGQFINPEGVAVDSSSNVYVADTNNHRIQKFNSSGSYLTQWGSAGSGNGQFQSPWGVAVDSSGNVYVADTGNNRIQKFSSSGSYLTQWGNYGSGSGQFWLSHGVAVDGIRNVYVADTANHRIQKFEPPKVDTRLTVADHDCHIPVPGQAKLVVNGELFTNVASGVTINFEGAFEADANLGSQVVDVTFTGPVNGGWAIQGDGRLWVYYQSNSSVPLAGKTWTPVFTVTITYDALDSYSSFNWTTLPYNYAVEEYMTLQDLTGSEDPIPPELTNLHLGCVDCSSAIPLTSGVPYAGTTAGGNTDVSQYACQPDWMESGPEVVHSITTAPAVSGDLVVTLEYDSPGFLDLFILNACDAANCTGSEFGASPYTLRVQNVQPDTTYYIVVDGYDGASGSYTLTAELPESYAISGYVRTSEDTGAIGIPGVRLMGFPAGIESPLTDANGYYSASGALLNGWSGAITPYKSYYSFTPANKSYANVSRDYTGEDYEGSTCLISGYVKTAGGDPIPDVMMQGFPLPDAVVTDETGYYAASGDLLLHWSGSVSPTVNVNANFEVSPQNRQYTNVISNQANQDYTGAVYGISGRVLDENGIAIPGVELYGFPLPEIMVTDQDGYYNTASYSTASGTFFPSGWSGTITPYKTGYTFSPLSITYTNLTDVELEQNYYTGAYQRRISGFVRDENGVGIPGVDIILENNPLPDKEIFTNENGYYIASGTALGRWTGTVTPTKAFYGFTPSNRLYPPISGYERNQNYTAAMLVLLAGLHQESVDGILYNGTWTVWCGSGPLGGCLTYSNDPLASAQFYFKGTDLILYRTIGANRGQIEVCIDDACQIVDNYNASQILSVPYAINDLTNEVHFMTITPISGEYLDLDALEVIDVTAPLQPGLYQEDAGSISYSGNWVTWSGSGPHGGGLSYTNDPAASAEFSIESTTLVIYRTLAPSRGSMEVCIDDVCQTVDNYDAGSIYTAPVTFANLSSGLHGVTINNMSSAYIDLDAVGVLTSSDVLGEGMYQQNDSRLTYSGAWTSYSGAGPNGGSLIYTSDPDATMQFRFNGTGLTLYRTLAASRGTMKICIDGNCQTVDSYNAATVWADPYEISGLPDGTHLVLITNTSFTSIDLDALEVLGGGAQHMEEAAFAPVIIRKAGTGAGTITAGEQQCDPDCHELVIPYMSDDSTIINVIPAQDSFFAGWETEGGELIGNVFYADPGETVIAVFNLK